MEPERFDTLVRQVMGTGSRRTLLRLAGGSVAFLLAGRGLGDGIAATSCAKTCAHKHSKRARRRCRKRCGPKPECRSSADCPAGELCESGVCLPIPDQCTSDADCDACERCDAGVCVNRCHPNEICRNDQCVIAPQCTSAEQCGACERCTNGRCVSRCQPSEHCQGGQCVPGCTPTTCAVQGKNCGSIPNGCGGTLACGDCTPPQTCGGGNPGTPNVCGCTPTTCGDKCGTVPDVCGGPDLICGSCFAGGPLPYCVNNVCSPCTATQSIGDSCTPVDGQTEAATCHADGTCCVDTGQAAGGNGTICFATNCCSGHCEIDSGLCTAS